MTRRDHLAALLPALLGFALLGRVGRAAEGDAGRWVVRQDQIASALSRGEMTGATWCDEVERLARETDMEALLAAVRKARATPAGRGSDNDPQKTWIAFDSADGSRAQLAFGSALFAFDPRNVITPHGHRHMVSAHLVIEGRLRVRNFDRIGDEPDALIIRPTRDYVAGPGAISTMCSERDNIHWFVPQGGSAATFDVIVSGIDAGESDHEITAIDPLGGEDIGGGLIRAPKLGFDDSARRYTANL